MTSETTRAEALKAALEEIEITAGLGRGYLLKSETAASEMNFQEYGGRVILTAERVWPQAQEQGHAWGRAELSLAGVWGKRERMGG